MPVQHNAQGFSWSGCGITQGLKKIALPEEWEKKVKDVTVLANTGVRTKKLSVLKDFADVMVTIEYDPAVTLMLTNNECVATLPDSGGSVTFWGQISKVGASEYDEAGDDDQPLQEITITLTNLNDSNVETAPSYAGA